MGKSANKRGAIPTTSNYKHRNLLRGTNMGGFPRVPKHNLFLIRLYIQKKRSNIFAAGPMTFSYFSNKMLIPVLTSLINSIKIKEYNYLFNEFLV